MKIGVLGTGMVGHSIVVRLGSDQDNLFVLIKMVGKKAEILAKSYRHWAQKAFLLVQANLVRTIFSGRKQVK